MSTFWLVRAMSKSPEDRYLSAGDLGRAAQAALSGTAVPVPERTVATGAAATREREAPTGKLAEEPEPPPSGNRRLMAAGLLAVVAVGVVVALLVSGGGGGDGDRATGETSVPSTAKEARNEGPKPRPQTLTEAQLIERGDEICVVSRAEYRQVRDPVLEEVPDVAYSKQLVANSTEAVREFNQLVPPASLQRAYGNFVASQEQVRQWDIDAMKAAEEGNEAAYLEAREDRNVTEDDRQALAEAVGFRECAGSAL